MFNDSSDSILDMQCVIEVNRDYPIFGMSRGLKIEMPGLITLSPDSVDLLLLVSKKYQDSRDMRIFLEKFNASDIGAMWVIKTSSREHASLKNFTLITDIPSSVIDGIVVSGGTMKIYTRFNHRFASTVSEALLEASIRKTGAFPLYLGKSKGRDFFLREISSAIDLDCVTLSSLPPEAEKAVDRNPVPVPWVREVRYLSKSTIDAVYNSSSISEAEDNDYNEHRYYEAKTKNPVLEAITSMTASVTVPTYSIVQQFDGNSFEMQFAIPSAYTPIFLRIVSEVDTKFPQWAIFITGIRQFSDHCVTLGSVK
ncbi:MAG: hypothetical protein QW597_02335 [Thermoplasmataceae archaeon]